MAQSLETRVTDLINEITALKQRYEQYPDVFGERLEQFTASFQNTIDNLDARTVFVDQINGDDNNDGASTRPVASLDAAFALVPEYGGARVILLSDIDVTQEVRLTQKRINIEGDYTLRQVSPGRIRSARCGHLTVNVSRIVTGLQENENPVASRSSAFFSGTNFYGAIKLSVLYSTIELGDNALVGSDKRPGFFNELTLAYNGVVISDQTRAEPKLLSSSNGNWSLNASEFSIPAGYTWADLIEISSGALLSNITV